jgi:3-oxoadipate CoA-transferase alpha subunit
MLVREKVIANFDAAVADIPNGATIMFGGFGQPGTPRNLIAALLRRRITNTIAISNRAGGGRGIPHDAMDVGRLVEDGCVRKVISTINGPVLPSNESIFEKMVQAGEIDSELVPQGTFAERIRAGGSGLGGFYTPTAVGTELAEGREIRRIEGRDYLFELPLRADFALLRAHRADRYGNLQFRRAQRNFAPLMARAAATCIVEVENAILEPGELDPDHIQTPGAFVDRMVVIPPPPAGIWDTPHG